MDKLSELIGWQQLRKINKSKFINTMYIWILLVPISARLLENIGDVATVTIFNYTFQAHLTLPFSWVTFYFSAIAFATANLIFQTRCPSIIKEHGDYSDFKQSHMGVEHLDRYMHQVGLNWEGLRQLLESQDNYFSEVAEVSNPKQDDGLLRKRFWGIYWVGNSYRVFSKYLAATLYVIGFSLISIVLVQNILFVLNYVVK